METTTIHRLKRLGQFVQKLGPYVLLEILLPGGTLIALLLFLYRSGRLAFGVSIVLRIGNVIDQALGSVREIVLLAQPSDIAALVSGGSGRTGDDGLEPLAMAPGA